MSPGWHFPGGGVEAGETCESALARELAEEANVVVEAPLRLHGLFFNVNVSRRDHVAVYVVARLPQSRASARRIGEILEARFFARDALPPDDDASHASAARRDFRRAAVSPLW